MIVFLRNIPVETRRRDIIAFIEPAMKASFFGKKGFIDDIQILHFKDVGRFISEYHALVYVEPDVVAKRVIKRLNRKSILHKHIAVREYQIRNWHNDPRTNHRPLTRNIAEKRIGERRRGLKGHSK